ncbi:hypothetical protein ACFPM0_14695 [Pseudonocardia sulfidoxydans]|uniref:hypothetical protein n=1 Tax=Pseudonocardia sulfidoxydans TaxID=54011 RepID=UPI00360DAE99
MAPPKMRRGSIVRPTGRRGRRNEVEPTSSHNSTPPPRCSNTLVSTLRHLAALLVSPRCRLAPGEAIVTGTIGPTCGAGGPASVRDHGMTNATNLDRFHFRPLIDPGQTARHTDLARARRVRERFGGVTSRSR